MIKSYLRVLYRALPFKRPIFDLFRRIGVSRWIPARLKGYLAFTGPFTVTIGTTGFTMLHGYGRDIEATIYWDGIDAFEPTTINWWRELSKRSTYIFDIGANTGIYSLRTQHIRNDDPDKGYINYLVCTPLVAKAIGLIA